jgi:hypothetical protein
VLLLVGLSYSSVFLLTHYAFQDPDGHFLFTCFLYVFSYHKEERNEIFVNQNQTLKPILVEWG